MAARTFTSAGVNNLWSNVANWDGGATIPAEDDSVTIPAGQTCEYDYNSAYTTGINGITITGTLKLSRTAATYRLYMKAASTIGGAGTFDCGASALDPIPFAAKHTITGGSGWYITGTAGLTMTVYAAEPAIPYILTSGAEAVGQTVIEVATDITSDIWADGDTIRIDDINGNDSEERTIAAGGRAAGAITITAGLTNAKIQGAKVILCSRHVKFIGLGVNMVTTFASGKLTVAGGQWTAPSKYIFTSCTDIAVSAGAFHASSVAFRTCTGANVTGGYFSGFTAVIEGCTIPTVSGGLFSGATYAINTSSGAIISGGVYSGTATGLCNESPGIFISGGTFAYNIYGLNKCNGFILSGITLSCITNNITSSAGIIKNCTLNTATYDINQSQFFAFNTALSGGTEVYQYGNLAKQVYSESIDHDASAGAFRSWTAGGITSSATATLPTGYTQYNSTALESATKEGFWQKEVLVSAGASVTISMALRKSASMTYLPRIITFNKASTDPFAGGAGLNTFTMTDSVDTWEYSSYVYTNTGATDVTLVIRSQGMNATGTMLSAVDLDVLNVDLTTVITMLTTLDTNVDSVLADTGTDGVLIAGTQGAVTFGQVKVVADVAAEGALDLSNANATGYGLRTLGVTAGQYNQGSTSGMYNYAYGAGGTGLKNVATAASSKGVWNTGVSKDVLGYDSSIATAANLATVDGNVDAILADTGTDGVLLASAAVDAVWDEATSGHTTAGSFGVWITKKLLSLGKFLGLK